MTETPVQRGAAITESMHMTPAQARFYLSKARYNAGPCGRRTGKTAIAKRRGAKFACNWRGPNGFRFLFTAPVHNQAKAIFWNDLKLLIPPKLRLARPSESDLIIYLKSGAIAQCAGLDKPDRIEGPPIAHVCVDEFANCKKEAWSQHIGPALIESRGTADLIGVPEGRNHYYDICQEAQMDDGGEWGYHHWTAEDVLPVYLGVEAAAEEIASAKRRMDDLTYQQEMLASFISFSGRAYYAFLSTANVRKLSYDPSLPIHVCFDFNVEPGVCVIVQEQEIEPGGRIVTCVIGEVFIPRNSNTPAVCKKLVADWKHHRQRVFIYGDPAGGQRRTVGERGTDWDIVREELRETWGDRMIVRVKSHQPGERVRINAVNSRCCTTDGRRHLFVDGRCRNTIKDFDGVQLLKGGSGEIDKKATPDLTHITDAIGYYIEEQYPIDKGTTRIMEMA